MLVNTVCGRGSVGRITADLYEAVRESGGEAVVAYGRGSAAQGIRSYRIGSRGDFYRHVCRNFFRGEAGFGSAEKTRAFLSFLDREMPDVLHLHNLHGFYLQVELLFAYLKQKRIPVVWTLHDCWAYTGHCAYYDRNGCALWKSGCAVCRFHASAYPYALFRDNAARSYARKRAAFTGVPNLTLVSPSEWLAGQVRASFLREYPILVLPNGIDLTRFSPGEAKRSGGVFTVLGAANVWEERKGLSFFRMLARRLPPQYRIRLIGLSGQQRRSFRRQFPESRVLAQGRTESLEALAQAYREADVFVNPTLEDNLPTANLEALACGTPVVTFAAGGSPETIGAAPGQPAGGLWRGGCGLSVETGNGELLLRAVQEACRKPPDREACRAQARRFDKQTQQSRYLALYESRCAAAQQKGSVAYESLGHHGHV